MQACISKPVQTPQGVTQKIKTTRHLFVAWVFNSTIMLSKGVPALQVMKMGGWKDMKTMMIYMRKAGIEVKSSLGRDSIKSQLRIANRLDVKYTLIFGQKEAIDGTIIIREMDTGIQETILLTKIVDEMKKRLKK